MLLTQNHYRSQQPKTTELQAASWICSTHTHLYVTRRCDVIPITRGKLRDVAATNVRFRGREFKQNPFPQWMRHHQVTSDRSELHARYALIRGAFFWRKETVRRVMLTLCRKAYMNFRTGTSAFKVPVLPKDKQSFSELLKISLVYSDVTGGFFIVTEDGHDNYLRFHSTPKWC